MKGQHFFQDAPSVGWLTWLFRQYPWSQPIGPSLLSASAELLNLNLNPQMPTPAQPSLATEYSQFLQLYFTAPESSHALNIPPAVLKAHLTSKVLLGVELRQGKGLVGLVFCWSAGTLLGQPTGLVTWLCIHPSFRKQGLSNRLLRALWKTAQPRPSFWFRTDGWLKSPLPPIWSESRIQRRLTGTHTVLSTGSSKTYKVSRVPFQEVAQRLQTSWTHANPTGLVLTVPNPPLLEVWTVGLGPSAVLYVLLQPTFEVQRATQEAWCEVIHWLYEGPTVAPFTLASYMETIWNAIPYRWVDAPQSLPHIESLWTRGGQTSWSAVGFDPGVPFTRPLLPLAIA